MPPVLPSQETLPEIEAPVADSSFPSGDPQIPLLDEEIAAVVSFEEEDDDEGPAEIESLDDSEPGSDETGDRPRRRRKRRRRSKGKPAAGTEKVARKPVARDDEDVEDEDDDLSDTQPLYSDLDDEEDGDEDGGTLAEDRHKGIPTWSEAIAVIIQTNLESRERDTKYGRPRDRGRGGSSGHRPRNSGPRNH